MIFQAPAPEKYNSSIKIIESHWLIYKACANLMLFWTFESCNEHYAPGNQKQKIKWFFFFTLANFAPGNLEQTSEGCVRLFITRLQLKKLWRHKIYIFNNQKLNVFCVLLSSQPKKQPVFVENLVVRFDTSKVHL